MARFPWLSSRDNSNTKSRAIAFSKGTVRDIISCKALDIASTKYLHQHSRHEMLYELSMLIRPGLPSVILIYSERTNPYDLLNTL